MLATGCATSALGPAETHDSVRDRLTEGPTHLYMDDALSTGVVTAQRWTPSGWISGDHELVIETGEVVAALDARGALSVKSFEVSVAPIEIPEEVFKKPAQLTDVRVKLATPTTGTVTWSGDNEASARLSVKLDLEWAIAIDGGKTPLGTQHLKPIDVDVTFGGDGKVVDATVGLAAEGELWNWAGLLEMTRLELQLQAETVD